MVRVENVEIHLEVKSKGGVFRLRAVPAHDGGGGSNDGGNVGGGGGGSGNGGNTDQVVNLLSYVNT